MKGITAMLLVAGLFFSVPLWGQEVILSDKEMLERELSLFTQHKAHIEALLRATDSLILNPALPGGEIDPLKTNIRILLPGDQLQDSVDRAMAGYALMNNLSPDAPAAVNFGSFVRDSLLQIDKQNRDLLMERFEQAEARIASLEFELETFGSESTQRETTAFEPGIDYQLTGRWRFIGGDEIQFTQLAANLWEGRYIHVENSIRRKAGYAVGMLVYRNVKYEPQTDSFIGEYLVRYADGSPAQWHKRELIISGNQMRTRRTGQTAVRLNK